MTDVEYILVATGKNITYYYVITYNREAVKTIFSRL